KLFAGYTHKTSGSVVYSIDHESVAFPVAARVAMPLANCRRNVGTPIERNHSRIVNHLRHKNHCARSLQDLVVALVSDRQLRRPVGDTTLLQRTVFWPGGHTHLRCRISVPSALSLRGQSGLPPIGR